MMPALATIGAMFTPSSLSIIVADRDDDAGDDALEQAAHGLGALHPAGAHRHVAGGGRVPAGGPSDTRAIRSGEDTLLGAADEPVDHPVEGPPKRPGPSTARPIMASGLPMTAVRAWRRSGCP